jgi:hypothetical protein
MYNIINHHGNAMQTALRFHLTPIRMAVFKKWKTTNVGKDEVKKEPLFSNGGNVT